MKQTHITSDNKVKISINIPERLLIELDMHRAETDQDRSTWIASAIIEKIASIRQYKGNKQ